MKTKSKILIFVCAFALIFSVVSVSCFAETSKFSIGSTYIFSSSPVLTDSSGDFYDFDVTGEILLDISGDLYDTFVVSGETIAISYGQDYAIYFNGPITGWSFVPDLSSSDYVEIDPPAFTVVSLSPYISLDFLSWIMSNSFSVSDTSFYSQIFSSISQAVFGQGVDLSPEQNFSLSLISTVLSFGMVLLPVLLAIGFLLRCFRL